MNKILKNYFDIVARIKLLSAESSFKQSVSLLVVSKGRGAAAITALFEQGQVDFAENYVQELKQKQQELINVPLNWHYIGVIQSNKINFLVKNVYWIHSVSCIEMVNKINSSAIKNNRIINICLQLNIDNSKTKSGSSLVDIDVLFNHSCSLSNLRVRGIMCILNKNYDNAINKMYMERAYSIFADLKAKSSNNCFDTLSLGMSGDMDNAVISGSNMVRIGSAIFDYGV